MRHQPLTASQMRQVAAGSATTRAIIGAMRVPSVDLQDRDIGAGTGNLKHDGRLYAAVRIGQFYYLTGEYA